MQLAKYIWNLLWAEGSRMVVIGRVAFVTLPSVLKAATSFGFGIDLSWIAWWQVGLFTVALFVILLLWRAISHGFALEQSLVPKIAFTHVLASQESSNEDVGMTYLRGRVEASENFIANRCTATVTSIEREVDGEFVRISPILPVRLVWANQLILKDETRVQPSVPAHFDIAWAQDTEEEFKLAAFVSGNKHPPEYSEHSSYRLTIAVNADGTGSVVKRVVVNWQGNWRALSGSFLND